MKEEIGLAPFVIENVELFSALDALSGLEQRFSMKIMDPHDQREDLRAAIELGAW